MYSLSLYLCAIVLHIFILKRVINCINWCSQLKVSLSIIANPLSLGLQLNLSRIQRETCTGNVTSKAMKRFCIFLFIYFCCSSSSCYCCCISILRVTKEAAHFYDGDMQQNWILWMPLWVFMNRIHCEGTKSSKGAALLDDRNWTWQL